MQIADSPQLPLHLHLDTSAFNFLLNNPDIAGKLRTAVLAGQVVLSHTHIQEDEVERTPPNHGPRRENLMDLFFKLGSECTPTPLFVIGTSKLDAACLGSDAVHQCFDELVNESIGLVNDSIIATTAISSGTILVLRDYEMQGRLSSCGYPFWTFDHLKDYLESSLID